MVGESEASTRSEHLSRHDRAAEGLEGLLDVLPALTDRGAVAEATARAAAAEIGTEAAALLLSREEAHFETLGAVGWSLEPSEVVLDELTSPMWRAALGKDAVWWRAGEPSVLEACEKAGWRRLLAVGVPIAGRRSGLLVVGDDWDEPLRPEAAGALRRLAGVAALALDRATQSEERATLERLMSAAVSTAGQLVAVGQPARLAERFVSALVDEVGFAGAVLWEPDEAESGALVRRTSRGLPTGVARAVAWLSPHSMAARLHDGRLPTPLARAGAAAASSSWPGHRVRLVVVPPPGEGVLGVYHREPLDSLIDGLLATLAQTFAAATHQATLHAQARAVVDSLQRELRPRELPPLGSDLEIGWIHQSATTGVEVGGDFFDVLRADTGHVGVACGDVAGKGVEAASLTAMAVHSLRAYALHGSSPGAVLRLLNATVCAQTSDERFVTLAYLRLDPGTAAGELALAGHLPPLRVRPGGHVEPVATPACLPAGVDPEAGYHETRVGLEPGEALVLYTDGVTEARRRPAADLVRGDVGAALVGRGSAEREPELLGEAGLARILAEAGDGDAQALADAVWQGVQAWTGGVTTDDCAVVVVRRRP